MKIVFYLSILTTLLTGCASHYNFVQPEFNHKSPDWIPSGEIYLEYQTQVMYLNKNKKQARKELNKNFSVLSVKIQNNTQMPVIVGKNAQFYSGNTLVFMFQDDESYQLLKQKWPFHFFYLGLTPLSGTFAIGGLYAAASFGIILGPGLAIYNTLKAAGNNKKLKNDLFKHSLLNREILPSESFSGILVIEGKLFEPLSLQIIGN